MTAKETIQKVTCKICGYSWWPRSDEKPALCANSTCRSMRWDKGPRTPKAAVTTGKAKGKGGKA